MNKLVLLIVIIIIIIIIVYLSNKKIEALENIQEQTSENNTIKQKKQGANFLGNNRTQQLDKLYENTDTYENIEGREGLDICMEKCKGNCVEFGMHGKAFCFT